MASLNLHPYPVQAGLVRRAWIGLGRRVAVLFRRSPALTYMYGALPTDPASAPLVERKTRRARQERGELVATQEEAATTGEGGEQTDVKVKQVYRRLVEQWRGNGKRPIDYFRFVLDPTCFGATVEAMFHLSFLVKEGKVRVEAEEDSLPTVAPIPKKEVDGAGEKQATVINFSWGDWQRLVGSLGVGGEGMVVGEEGEEAGGEGGE